MNEGGFPILLARMNLPHVTEDDVREWHRAWEEAALIQDLVNPTVHLSEYFAKQRYYAKNAGRPVRALPQEWLRWFRRDEQEALFRLRTEQAGRDDRDEPRKWFE
jgi:hypothetical protein